MTLPVFIVFLFTSPLLSAAEDNCTTDEGKAPFVPAPEALTKYNTEHATAQATWKKNCEDKGECTGPAVVSNVTVAALKAWCTSIKGNLCVSTVIYQTVAFKAGNGNDVSSAKQDAYSTLCFPPSCSEKSLEDKTSCTGIQLKGKDFGCLQSLVCTSDVAPSLNATLNGSAAAAALAAALAGWPEWATPVIIGGSVIVLGVLGAVGMSMSKQSGDESSSDDESGLD